MDQTYESMDAFAGNYCSACLYFTRGYLQDAHNSVDCNEFHQRPGNSSSCRVSAGTAKSVGASRAKDFWISVVPFERSKESGRFDDKTIDALVTACYEMGKVKTGALIVVEQEIMLTEYQNTGIELDCLVSSQVLINIFEHNTPLHDGAVIVRGNRIVSATCYLPLSDNMGLSKELGTRHRAAVGMSEVSDALVITVSEETGYVSIAMGGHLTRNVKPEFLREKLVHVQNKSLEEKRFMIWKGRRKNEKETDK